MTVDVGSSRTMRRERGGSPMVRRNAGGGADWVPLKCVDEGVGSGRGGTLVSCSRRRSQSGGWCGRCTWPTVVVSGDDAGADSYRQGKGRGVSTAAAAASRKAPRAPVLTSTPSVVEPEYRGKGTECRNSELAKKAASLVQETLCVVVLVLFTMRDGRELLRVIR